MAWTWTVNKNVKTRAFFLLCCHVTAYMKSNHDYCGRLLEWEEMAKRVGVCKEQYVGKCIYSACPGCSAHGTSSRWRARPDGIRSAGEPTSESNTWVAVLFAWYITGRNVSQKILLSTNLSSSKSSGKSASKTTLIPTWCRRQHVTGLFQFLNGVRNSDLGFQ